MITGALKSKVDSIWNTMWSGGISNPLSVIEQLTYLLFIKRLDELHTLKERKAARTGKPIEDPIEDPLVFTAKQDKLRWSLFMMRLLANVVERPRRSRCLRRCATECSPSSRRSGRRGRRTATGARRTATI